jgi:hypothetical protein
LRSFLSSQYARFFEFSWNVWWNLICSRFLLNELILWSIVSIRIIMDIKHQIKSIQFFLFYNFLFDFVYQLFLQKHRVLYLLPLFIPLLEPAFNSLLHLHYFNDIFKPFLNLLFFNFRLNLFVKFPNLFLNRRFQCHQIYGE